MNGDETGTAKIKTLVKKTGDFESKKAGAGGGSRTHKSFTSEDFKSSASAYSATPAMRISGGDERIRTAE
jgi:hypothetical protein